MHSFNLTFILTFLLVGAIAAPVPNPPQTPVVHNHGDFVGVRPGAYEEKTPENNHDKISIHPGVVVGGPHPETGIYNVAMISKKIPHNPPQAPIEHFHPGSTVYGNIALSPPKEVMHTDMKPWKDEKTGITQSPMTPSNLANLRTAMIPHTGWKPPTPPPSLAPHALPQTHLGPHGAHVPASQGSSTKKGQQVNAHASSSRHPAPANPRLGSRPARPASNRPATNPSSHHPASNPAFRRPAAHPASHRPAHPAAAHPASAHPASAHPASVHPASVHPAAHPKAAGSWRRPSSPKSQGPSNPTSQNPGSSGSSSKKGKGKRPADSSGSGSHTKRARNER
ncbi:hypothetical protein BDZ97DRAFT_1922348 [Flammula alnicola]|nr:hypothetical protein BDZ97DRAFT_1922348 [Flammula alnicola]